MAHIDSSVSVALDARAPETAIDAAANAAATDTAAVNAAQAGGPMHQNPPLGAAAPLVKGDMQVAAQVVEVCPERAPQLIDITGLTTEFVGTSGLQAGLLTVHALHTTAAIIVNEKEPLLHQDIESFLERLAPTGGPYRHDDFAVRTTNMVPGERANGHSHLRHLMLGATETLPVCGGQIALGRWQRLFFVELDGARPRRVLLQLFGTEG